MGVNAFNNGINKQEYLFKLLPDFGVFDIAERYFIDNSINSESELKEKEDSNFSTIDLKQRNLIRFNEFLRDRTHLENYDQNVIYELEQLRKEIESSNNELYKTSSKQGI